MKAFSTCMNKVIVSLRGRWTVTYSCPSRRKTSDHCHRARLGPDFRPKQMVEPRLKKKYGCFAGAESSNFPGTKRRAGIPSMVIIGPDGAEKVHMDCDPPVEINRKGDGVLEDWMPHKW